MIAVKFCSMYIVELVCLVGDYPQSVHYCGLHVNQTKMVHFITCIVLTTPLYIILQTSC
jgi:hypothetical protein